MGKVRIARLALLRAVDFHGIDIGTIEGVLVRARIVGLDPLDKFKLPDHGRPTRRALFLALPSGAEDTR